MPPCRCGRPTSPGWNAGPGPGEAWARPCLAGCGGVQWGGAGRATPDSNLAGEARRRLSVIPDPVPVSGRRPAGRGRRVAAGPSPLAQPRAQTRGQPAARAFRTLPGPRGPGRPARSVDRRRRNAEGRGRGRVAWGASAQRRGGEIEPEAASSSRSLLVFRSRPQGRRRFVVVPALPAPQARAMAREIQNACRGRDGQSSLWLPPASGPLGIPLLGPNSRRAGSNGAGCPAGVAVGVVGVGLVHSV